MFDGPLLQGTLTDVTFVLLPELEQVAPFEQLDHYPRHCYDMMSRLHVGCSERA